MIQAEARKNGLRYDSMSGSLEQRDYEIANSAAFRKSLYDYDVEESVTAYLIKNSAQAISDFGNTTTQVTKNLKEH